MNATPGSRSLSKRILRRLKRLAGIDAPVPGKHPRECPICGYRGLFQQFGDPPRRDAQCPKCASLERHRLLKLWVDRAGGSIARGRAIHFAPEPAVVGFLSKLATEYVTADIEAGKADVVRNIEKIAEPDQSFSLVVCSHVLEHVDDRKALQELRRILGPNGTMILMVPIVEGWDTTYENPAAVSAADRELYFGQSDHVRYYGRDFRQRVREAGFALAEFTATEPDVSRYSISRGEKVFIATHDPTPRS